MNSGKIYLSVFLKIGVSSMTMVCSCYLHSALQCIVHRNDSHIHPILGHTYRYLDMGWDGNSP